MSGLNELDGVMTPLTRLQEYRQIAIEMYKLSPDAHLIVKADGSYIRPVDDDSFCCGTTISKQDIKLT